MRIARYTTGQDPTYGIVQDDDDGARFLAEVRGDPLYQPITYTGVLVPFDDARLLAPVIPRSKVIGIGKNYADHVAEMGGGRGPRRAAGLPQAQHLGGRPR